MLKLTLNEIKKLIDLNDNNNFNDNKIFIENISTDSKKILKNSIFIALVGKNFNGHDFIDEAITNGAKVVICNKEYNFKKKYSIPILFVNNTYKTIEQIAKNYRQKYLNNVKIIAITGSVGKTTTKEILFKILNVKYKVYRTEKNFNNFIGVTKTIFNIHPNYDIAVIEFGMSYKNEIDCLTNITKPDIMIITNIGTAHIENFNSKEEILNAKLEIINYKKNNDILIINSDDKLLNNLKISNINKYNFAINNHFADIYIDNLIYNEIGSIFDVYYKNKIFIKNCKLKIAGKHNIYNALCGILVGKIFNIEISNIKKSLLNFKNIGLRQKIHNIACNKNIFIEDCYNASPESMIASFKVIKQYKKFKILVLGKMNELGKLSKNIHTEIGEFAEKIADLIILVGNNDEIINYTYGIKNKKKYVICKNCDEVAKYLYINNIINSVILIKGSRSNYMENIIQTYNNYNSL